MKKKENLYIKGKYICLSFPTENDAKKDWYKWFNNHHLLAVIGRFPWPNSKRDQINYLNKIRNSRNRILLAIRLIKSSKMIGVISLSKINSDHRNAESSIIIGDEKYRNGVHALESMALITELGLINLNLNRIYSSTLLINEGAFSLNKILGWRKVGVCKQSHYYKGKYVDSVIYEILKKDWIKSKKRPL